MADYAAVQKQLNALGQDPPLAVDGVYGPKTRAAVIAFQQSKGLVPDGIVGPKTCAALGIEDGSPSSSSGNAASTMGFTLSPTVQKYYTIAKNAAQQAGMTEQQFQYTFTVAMGEGGFGEGWAHPSADTIAKSQENGLTGYEGAGSNNWGATQGSGDAGSFPHVDTHADGSTYVGYYKKWSTPEKGYLDMAGIILNGGLRGAAGSVAIKDAIARGNLTDAVNAQHANGYFELAPDKYLAAVMTNYQKLASGTGWKQLLGQLGPATTASIGVAGFLVVGGLGYFGWRLFRALVLKS